MGKPRGRQLRDRQEESIATQRNAFLLTWGLDGYMPLRRQRQRVRLALEMVRDGEMDVETAEDFLGRLITSAAREILRGDTDDEPVAAVGPPGDPVAETLARLASLEITEAQAYEEMRTIIDRAVGGALGVGDVE